MPAALLFVLIFLQYPCPTYPCYTIFAQVARLTTVPIDFSIKVPTKSYIATLVPRGCNDIFLLKVTPYGLLL